MNRQSKSPGPLDTEIRNFIEHLGESIILLSSLENRNMHAEEDKPEATAANGNDFVMPDYYGDTKL